MRQAPAICDRLESIDAFGVIRVTARMSEMCNPVRSHQWSPCREPEMDDAEVAATGMTQEDDLLAARADATAFARLYEAYRLPVYRYLRSRSSADDDAADLTAITFERIFRGLGGYRPQGSPIGWILRIARNTAIDASRRRRPRSIPLEGVQADQQPASDLSPEDDLSIRRAGHRTPRPGAPPAGGQT